MKEFCNAIDENELCQFVLKPKNPILLYGEIKGKVKEQKDGKVYIEIWNWDSFKRVNTGDTYSMHFQANSKNFELQTNALEFIDKHDLFDCLIKNPAYSLRGEFITNVRVNYQLSPEDQRCLNIRYYKELSQHQSNLTSMHNTKPSIDFNDLNAEQKTAIGNIVNGDNYPLPYLLYGPPGELFLLIFNLICSYD